MRYDLLPPLPRRWHALQSCHVPYEKSRTVISVNAVSVLAILEVGARLRIITLLSSSTLVFMTLSIRSKYCGLVWIHTLSISVCAGTELFDCFMCSKRMCTSLIREFLLLRIFRIHRNDVKQSLLSFGVSRIVTDASSWWPFQVPGVRMPVQITNNWQAPCTPSFLCTKAFVTSNRYTSSPAHVSSELRLIWISCPM